MNIQTSTSLFVFVSLLASLEGRPNLKICKTSAGNYPKPGSFCKSYYKCLKFLPVEKNCPDGMHFNAIKRICDSPELYPCFEKLNREECPRENGRFVKRGTHCKRYYDCCNGNPTEKQCPLNQAFDPLVEKCEWTSRYTCIEDTSSTNFPSISIFTTHSSTPVEKVSTSTETLHDLTTSTITSDFPETTYNSDSTDTKLMTTQETSSFPAEIVSTSTELFEDSSSSITTSDASETTDSSSSTELKTSQETSSLTIEDVSNSTELFEDSSTSIITSDVPETTDSSSSTVTDLMTSQETSSLTVEDVSNSTEILEDIFTFSTSQQETDAITEDGKKSTYKEASQSTDPEVRTQQPDDLDFWCPEPFGYFPHPTDKHKFIGCVNDIPSVMDCPSNLVYRHEIRQCDYE